MLVLAFSWTVIGALPLLETGQELLPPPLSNDTAEGSVGELHLGGDGILLLAHLSMVSGLCQPTMEEMQSVASHPHYALSAFAEAEEALLFRHSGNLSLAQLIESGNVTCSFIERKLNHIGQRSDCPWIYSCSHDIYRYPRFIVEAKCRHSGRTCSSCSSGTSIGGYLPLSTCREVVVDNLPVFTIPKASCPKEGEGSGMESISSSWDRGEMSIGIGCECRKPLIIVNKKQ